MPHYRGMYKHGGRHCTHHSPPAFLVHAGQGSNPKLCILTPEATLWSQHNFQLLELARARQGRSGDSAFSLWFLCQSLVCFFHVLQFSSFLMLFSIPCTRAFLLADKGHHPGQSSTQSASNPSAGSSVWPSATFPALQDMHSVPWASLCPPPGTHLQGHEGNLRPDPKAKGPLPCVEWF